MNKVEAMKRSGKINREVMKQLFISAKPGISLIELNSLAEELISNEKEAIGSFKGYNEFPAVICTNVNNGLIHGIPSEYKLREGDLLTIDQGVYYGGYHTDHGWTEVIGNRQELLGRRLKEEFLKVGNQALENAISEAVAGNRVGDISFAIQQTIEKARYFVVKEYVGHGVGEKLHEWPEIPCYGKKDTGPKIVENQTLAIEVMYTSKPSKLLVSKDNWTVEAKADTLSALFEKTILVRRNKSLVLT